MATTRDDEEIVAVEISHGEGVLESNGYCD
jgi:hypothetical protein